MKEERVWEYSFRKHKWRWEINVGVYPPTEDDYFLSCWSLHFSIGCFNFGLMTYLVPIDVQE